MVELGAELGSDVPFFIYQRPAIVTGRGEKVTPIENFPLYYGILIYPNIAISTKKMYAAFDLQLTKERLNVSNHEFLAHIQELEFTSSLEFFHNDFDSLCVSLYPEIAEVKALFLESNALLAQVSGSGSSVFGIYENEKEQADAYTWLKNRCKDTNYNIEIIKTLGDASHQNLAPST